MYQSGDFLAAQAVHPAAIAGSRLGPLRGDPGAPAGEEVTRAPEPGLLDGASPKRKADQAKERRDGGHLLPRAEMTPPVAGNRATEEELRTRS
ncbi:hypothetical protein GCM10020219_049460 [Nonomuraea dietziae]